MEHKNSQITIQTNSKSHKWAEHLCFALIATFNLSSWIDLNSVWIELPLIVNSAPERWTLPSLCALMISLANIVPLLVLLLRWRLGSRFSEIPYIYAIILIGILACFSIGLFWDWTVFIFHQERSVPLIVAVFALAMLDCTSSLVFCDYMKRFRAKYLSAMFFGEGLTGTLPTLLALAQGIGGEARCFYNNQTLEMEPIYSKPRFSVSVFFYLVTGIIGISLLAFMILRLTPIIQLANAKDKIDQTSEIDACETLLKIEETLMPIRKHSLSTPNSMTTKQYCILQLVSGLNSAILYGCLPTLITYSLLPYGQKIFYYCSILYPVAYPLSSFCAIFRPTISISLIILGSIFGSLISLFIIILAFQSPCPIWADTIHGGIFMIIAWFLSSLVLSYVRIASGNRIKLAWKNSNGLFYFGLSVQIGYIFGALPMYAVINIYDLIEDRKPCQKYCL